MKCVPALAHCAHEQPRVLFVFVLILMFVGAMLFLEVATMSGLARLIGTAVAAAQQITRPRVG